MKLGYFPGCSLLGSAREYDESLRAIAYKLGFSLIEVPDWNCCGASAAHNINHLLSIALPLRILALSEKERLDELLVPCSACYSRLMIAQNEINEDPELKKKALDVIEMDYTGSVRILNIIELLEKISDEIAKKMVKPFNYKVASYYGCLLVRPPKIVKFDRPEDPQTLDELMKKIGAEPIDWAYKVECCGAGFSISRTDLVAKLSSRIVEDATNRGADAIIVACPMCHSNLDMRREQIEKFSKKKFSIPVLYITQAIGLALGVSEKELGLQRHMVPVVLPVKEKVEISEKCEQKPEQIEAKE